MSRAAMVLCVTLLSLSQVDTADAFDGKRRGFVLGFGAGPAAWSVVEPTGRDLKLGPLTDLKIGHGISDRVLVYYTGLTMIAGLADGAEDGRLVILPSVGVRYYRKGQSPSSFGEIGAGFAIADDPAANEINFVGGFVPHLGIGYEMGNHVSFEGVAFAGRLKSASDVPQGDFFKRLFWGFAVVVQVLAY